MDYSLSHIKYQELFGVVPQFELVSRKWKPLSINFGEPAQFPNLSVMDQLTPQMFGDIKIERPRQVIATTD